MSSNQLSVENDFLFSSLQIEIAQLNTQLLQLKLKIHEFENFLRLALEDQIIEEQELSSIERQLKKAKKQKRLEQKRKGKNYQAPLYALTSSDKKSTPQQTTTQASKKKLYREAMLYVHPDKFSDNKANEELALEITTKLIATYKEGTLAELQQLHGEIVRKKELSKIAMVTTQNQVTLEVLKTQKETLLKELTSLKNRHTYVVLTTYKDPKTYITDLENYYEDRLMKLRKRTRKFFK